MNVVKFYAQQLGFFQSMISSNLCVNCKKPIEPERVELGLLLCFKCADDRHDEVVPKALIHSVSKEGDFEIEVVNKKDFNHIQSYGRPE